jgi:nucleotide-binding universal stress UspA family protein
MTKLFDFVSNRAQTRSCSRFSVLRLSERYHGSSYLSQRQSASGTASIDSDQLRASASETHKSGARNVVVAVDASEDSVTAFRWTIENVWRPGDNLHILHVVPDFYSGVPAPGSIFYPGESYDEDMDSTLVQQARDFIREFFIADANGRGIGNVHVVLVKEARHKHVGRTVCIKAEELEASPLVLSAHHRNALEEMFLGSVSKYCAAHCKRPILLVNPMHSQLDN